MLGKRWDLPKGVQRLLSLTCFAHDLGRFPQAVIQAGGIACNPEHHGKLSVELLRDLEPLIPDAWLCFSEAVEKHSLRNTPQKREFVSEIAWALCSVVRDIDKMAGFTDAHAYTHDVGRKTREARANTLAWTEENPTAEMGAIVTLQGFPDVLQTFLEGQTVTRAHCASYEAYMLQLLAWLYDFNLAEVRDEVIAQGGPGIVVAYLRERLAGNPQWQRISLHTEAWGL